MTTLYTRETTCAACGHKFETTEVGSTNEFGSMDLDMRPPPMKRDILDYEIQECPRCHSCLPQIHSLPDGVDPAWVQDANYLAVACDAQTPDLPRRFLAYAHLAKRGGEGRAYIWANLSASWGFDDLGLDWVGRAAACREAAVEAIRTLHATGKSFADDQQTDQILCLDLLRRARRFEDAEVAAKSLIRSAPADVLISIARFQASRSLAKDDGRYTVEEAIRAG